MNKIQVNRGIETGIYNLEDVFTGLSKSEILLKIFESKAELDDVFSSTRVIIDSVSRYMRVKNEDASIIIGKEHLKNSEKKILYLDIVHELVHVRQQRKGLDLYDESYSYVDRPTEVEAYAIAVQEARNLGMKDDEIFDYLHVEWISPDEHRRLASRVGLSL